MTAPPVSFQGEIFADQPPSFAPPDVRSDRIGVIDVGSNSVRLVVFDGQCRSPQILFNEKVMCGLGAALDRTGMLDARGAERALRALTRFVALAPQLRVGALAAVATAAVRDARDGPEFCAQVARRTGIRLRVATGADEARLAAKGVLFGNPRADGVVVDLGGASLEFCRVRRGRPEQGLTTPLGPLRLSALAERGGDADREIARYLDTLAESFRLDGGCLYLVGGAWRALARTQMMRMGYPLQVLHEYRMTPHEGADLSAWVLGARADKLAVLTGLGAGRLASLPVAGRLLGHLIRVLAPGSLQVSAFGLREGVCLDNLSSALMAQDVLLAGAAEQEARRARAPGFGRELGDWVCAFLTPTDAGEERLMRAAALLSDVNWRTHPDYRAQGCWETVTRVNLTDLGHRGRVFLGAALVARYKGARRSGEPGAALSLLAEGQAERAVQLGLAMRLGSVIAGSAPGILDHCRLTRRKRRLILSLSGPARLMDGEEVEKRLTALARTFGCDGAVLLNGQDDDGGEEAGTLARGED